MKRLITAAALASAVVFAGAAHAAPFEMLCEHPVSHQQIRLAIANGNIHFTDPDGRGADYAFGDTLRNPSTDAVVNFHFGEKCEPNKFCTPVDFFVNFSGAPIGFAATLSGIPAGGHQWKTYCIVPGRIVQ